MNIKGYITARETTVFGGLFYWCILTTIFCVVSDRVRQ